VKETVCGVADPHARSTVKYFQMIGMPSRRPWLNEEKWHVCMAMAKLHYCEPRVAFDLFDPRVQENRTCIFLPKEQPRRPNSVYEMTKPMSKTP
jgi:hypothetical protein